MNNKQILFDFGTIELSEDIIRQLDYIFISHYHYDHTCGLLEKLEKIPNDCKIYMTRTTKEVFEYIIKRQNYKENKCNKLLKILTDRFRIALFNKVLSFGPLLWWLYVIH